MNNYRVLVPILLELEVETTLGPAEALAAIMDSFNKPIDPLLGAGVRFEPRGNLIAHTTGATLNGRAYLTDAKQNRRN